MIELMPDCRVLCSTVSQPNNANRVASPDQGDNHSGERCVVQSEADAATLVELLRHSACREAHDYSSQWNQSTAKQA